MVLGLNIWEHMTRTLPYPTSSFDGQTVIVTGSNTGLGLEAARHIVRLGAAKVILAVRDVAKGAAAASSITASTGRDPSIVDVWKLDLASYASVQAFAGRALAELPRIDCLIQNAGVALLDYTTAEKDEASITVNLVSPALLSLLLLPMLQASAAIGAAAKAPNPRISIVASEWHVLVSLPPRAIFDTLNTKPSPSQMRQRYNVTKLMQVLFARELAAQLRPSSSSTLSSSSSTPETSSPYPDVAINAVDAGIVRSGILRGLHGWPYWVMTAMRAPLARNTEHGSRAVVYGAAAGREAHGLYLGHCRVVE
jgi:retinol dehydrogenase 12